jgi:AAA15 family ATPase/GTPase
MIDSLHIQNYRLFKDLKIDKLGQVNLIAGKNNTGKTALLEVMRILGSKADNGVINDIVNKRGDFELGNTDSFHSLFNNFENFENIVINDITFLNSISVEVEYGSAYDNDKKSKRIKNYELEADYVMNNPNGKDCIYIPLQFDSDNNAKFWDKISLTSKELDVIDILKIVDKKIITVRYDTGNAKVLLEGESYPRFLKNLGEGVNRLFTIALALVNSQHKTLLIDEFEVGLHQSVQKQLWEIIFKYAKLWNIQVFVTTHSHDTVKAFATVWNEKENLEMGQYFRLTQDKTDPTVIYPEFYDHEELLSSIYNLEPR